MREVVFAPGSRIVVRDAEWLVRRVDRTSTGGQALSVVGISELVKDKEAIFLTEIEKNIEILDPAQTKLVHDESSSYQASLLYMESLLRQTPPTDENLYIGHLAAIDVVPYQLDPALQALEQPRHRILMADAVGLGKTIEAGILLSELIRRGKGKRILVVTLKSMLTQFQKELWSRFTIPLARLDSVGIQRIRSQIPTNQNPFYYYDRAIISIDTLKQDTEYRTYLENAYWDIIVIDEAHNVAERGKGSSLRSRLAKLLARRSDTLIMLSATPHDGKARSFASLMNMLDPTAISDPDNYGPEDIKGLFIRRFKKDIQSQVETAFKEREIKVARCVSSPAEEVVFDTFANITFTRVDQHKGAGELFKTTLEKALFSSPAACLETIRNRLMQMTKSEDPTYNYDINSLKMLEQAVEKIGPKDFSKYQKLLEIVKDPFHGFGWTGKNRKDRLVIFTERIATLNFLKDRLPGDLGLKERQVEILHGGLPDTDQQRIVEDFGKEESPIRLLIASDVASEGINLHYLCYRMIHFDIPWSLMVFQQRNGRIDRYGQERIPQIIYLVTEAKNPKIRGDMRILELLIKKDEQAIKNIGDPSALMGVYDIEEEEEITARAIEEGKSAEEFDKSLESQKQRTFDPLALLMGEKPLPSDNRIEEKLKVMPTLYGSDFDYVQVAIQYLRQSGPLQAELDPENQRIELTAPEDLQYRFRYLPKEIWPEDGYFSLSSDKKAIQDEIKRSRKDEKAWPRIHYLWPLNPVVEWINDKVLSSFACHEAPILIFQDALEEGEIVFLLSGLIPNRKGHPLIHRWFGAVFVADRFQAIEEFDSLLERTGLGKKSFPNPGGNVHIKFLQGLLPEAVRQARIWLSEQRKAFEEKINKKLNEQYAALERLKKKQYMQLEFRFKDSRQPERLVQARKEKERREIDRIFDEYLEWVEDTMTTEDNPYIQVIAVLDGSNLRE